MRRALTRPPAGCHPCRPWRQIYPQGITVIPPVLFLVLMVGLLTGRAAGLENAASSPGAALRAAQDRLLDRLWQMPFYLVAAKPSSASPLSSAARSGAMGPETDAQGHSGYGPWRENIVATVFWVGETACAHNPVPNDASAWDREWLKTFGGIDNPRGRTGVFPATFLPKRNPFYVALPFNDLLNLPDRPPLADLIPWAAQRPPHPGSGSLCHGAWVAVRNAAGRICYAQWEDVGPFEVNHWQYVFGGERPRPNRNGGAGIDLSPAVRDYLNLHGLDVVDWRFVRKEGVPAGPWLYYGRDGDKLNARLVVNALRTLVNGNE